MSSITHNRVNERRDVTPQTLDASVLNAVEPIVLRGFGRQWPVVRAARESLDSAVEYLRSVYEGYPVTTCRGAPSEKGRVYYNDAMTGFNFVAEKGDFSAFLEEMLNEAEQPQPRMLYMPSTDVRHWFPRFAAEQPVGIDDLQPIKLLWAGNQTRIAAHYDFPSNLACCVVGRRRFTLFPPEQISNLYPGPINFAPGGQEISMVDLAAPDFAKFPKFAKAMEHALVAELDVGDALLLPGMWWHHVEGLDALNVLYTHWWRSSPAFMGLPDNALLAALLSLRGLPKVQRDAWRALFEHYIFDHDVEDISTIPREVQGMLKLPMDELDARKLRAELLNRLKI